jgi:hypothetical protein
MPRARSSSQSSLSLAKSTPQKREAPSVTTIETSALKDSITTLSTTSANGTMGSDPSSSSPLPSQGLVVTVDPALQPQPRASSHVDIINKSPPINSNPNSPRTTLAQDTSAEAESLVSIPQPVGAGAISSSSPKSTSMTSPPPSQAHDQQQIQTPPLGPAPQPIQCSNCKTHTTPLWRRDSEGKSICNACGESPFPFSFSL